MAGLDDNARLLDILGQPSYDNLGDPVPWANRPQTLLGLVISFLVDTRPVLGRRFKGVVNI